MNSYFNFEGWGTTLNSVKITSSFLLSFSPTFQMLMAKSEAGLLPGSVGTRLFGLVLAASYILRVLIQGLAVLTSLLRTDTCCLCLLCPGCLGLAVLGQLALLPGQIR